MPAENIQRQKAVAIVETVEILSDLIAMNGIVGGIKIQNQPFRRLRKATDELIDQHFMHCNSGVPVRSLLKPTQCRRATQGPVALDGCLQRRIAAQCIVVIQVFVACRHGVHPLAQHAQLAVLTAPLNARVFYGSVQGLGQPNLAVHAAQQQHPPPSEVPRHRQN